MTLSLSAPTQCLTSALLSRPPTLDEVDHTLQFSTLGADELAILYTDEYFELAYCDDNTKSDKSKEAQEAPQVFSYLDKVATIGDTTGVRYASPHIGPQIACRHIDLPPKHGGIQALLNIS